MTEETNTPPAAEQAADLAALTAAATEGSGAPVATTDQAQAGPQPPSASAIQLATMAVGMLRPLLGFAVPALRNAPDELWQPIPEGVAGVLDHYGMQAEWLESPWARLAFAMAPLAAYAALETMKEKPKEPERIAGPDLTAAPPAQPVGQKTVTMGAPLPAEA